MAFVDLYIIQCSPHDSSKAWLPTQSTVSLGDVYFTDENSLTLDNRNLESEGQDERTPREQIDDMMDVLAKSPSGLADPRYIVPDTTMETWKEVMTLNGTSTKFQMIEDEKTRPSDSKKTGDVKLKLHVGNQESSFLKMTDPKSIPGIKSCQIFVSGIQP
ncbi:hypothetical protein F5880DRAFT_1615313 [Lentinula raphanica]|nr:hypothetical protein F5880DRAFT_1615313 [Lentinula raphanica]